MQRKTIKIRGLEAKSYNEQLRAIDMSRLAKRRFRNDMIAVFQYLGCHKRERVDLFSKASDHSTKKQ